MSETNWGEGEAAPKKKKVPTWLWFCGGGCLLAVVLTIALGGWLYTKFKDSGDAEKQWPRLAAVLPYDARPADVELTFGVQAFYEMYAFEDKAGFVEVLMQLSKLSTSERDKLFDPTEHKGLMGQGQRKNASAAMVNVQGRDLRALRFDQMDPEDRQSQDGLPKPGKGPSILVDLTPDGGDRAIFLQMIRVNGREPVADEDVQRFLKTFHVGPVR